jgi:hypothetical protein
MSKKDVIADFIWTWFKPIRIVLASMVYIATNALIVCTADPVAAVFSVVGVILGYMQPSVRGVSWIVLPVVFIASLMNPVQDDHGVVYEVYPPAWMKATFPTLCDFGTPRDGYLMTVLHSDEPWNCYMQNSASKFGETEIRPVGSWDDFVVVKKQTCLMVAAKRNGIYTPPHTYRHALQVLWVMIFPAHITSPGMVLNEVVGCIERVCFMTFTGFFIGLSFASKTMTDAYNLQFSGKYWMVSFICSKLACLILIVVMSHSHRDTSTRMDMFKGEKPGVFPTILLIMSDPFMWYAGFRWFGPVGFELLCDIMFPRHRTKRINDDAKRAKKATDDDAKRAKKAADDDEKRAKKEAKAAADATKAWKSNQMPRRATRSSGPPMGPGARR